MIEYLTKEEIIELNKLEVFKSADPFAVTNEANLEYIVDACKYKYEGKEEKEALVLKGSFLILYLARDAHAFAEGNKRTSLHALLSFLDKNGFSLLLSDEREVIGFMLQVAMGKLSSKQVENWIKARIIKV